MVVNCGWLVGWLRLFFRFRDNFSGRLHQTNLVPEKMSAIFDIYMIIDIYCI